MHDSRSAVAFFSVLGRRAGGFLISIDIHRETRSILVSDKKKIGRRLHLFLVSGNSF